MAYLSAEFTEVFAKVEFKQGNLARAASVAAAFAKEGGCFDVVINCAALTKYPPPLRLHRMHFAFVVLLHPTPSYPPTVHACL
jgi:hypothetical protein